MKHIKQQHFNHQAQPRGSGLLACSSGTCLTPDFKGLDSADAINLTEDATQQLSSKSIICNFSALLILLTLASMPTSSTHAADFNVACGDVTGLIAAIDSANANGEANTITLAADCTYTLTAVNNVVNNGGTIENTGLPLITSEMILEGNDAIIERDSSAPDFGLLQVSAAGNLTLDSLTIQGGNQGAIRNFNGMLTVRNSAIRNSSGGLGGRHS